MNKKNRIPNDYFWRLIDEYESNSKTVRRACKIIARAHKTFCINNIEEAIADYERLTNKNITKFVIKYLSKIYYLEEVKTE